MAAPKQEYVTPESVVAAIERLVELNITDTARVILLGYLTLKSIEATPGGDIEVSSGKDTDIRRALDRYFRVAPEHKATPYLVPFGKSEGYADWRGGGIERRNVYTPMYQGRALDRFLPVRREGRTPRSVRIPADRAKALTDTYLHEFLPLEPTATFLLRHEDFPSGADRDALVQRFQAVFHLSDQERDDLFAPDPGFAVAFAPTAFDDALASLPLSLHPRPASAGQAGVARAARTLGAVSESTGGLVLPESVLRRARLALALDRAIALVGPPGSGKSRLADQLVEEARIDPANFGFSSPPEFYRYTAEADWTARTLIGGHFPQSDGRLLFQEGYLLTAVKDDRWLIIDEMNRADLDRVLGPFLTFLAGQPVNIGKTELTDQGKSIQLVLGADADSGGMIDDENQRVYVASTSWRVLGTYNSVDLGRVFSMGGALNRRWTTVPVPPVPPDRLPEVLRQHVPELAEGVATTLRQLYALHLAPNDAGQIALPLGPGPFVGMARYVQASTGDPPMAETRVLLHDAYILYVGPQLRRLSGQPRVNLLEGLRSILGGDLVDELNSTFG